MEKQNNEGVWNNSGTFGGGNQNLNSQTDPSILDIRLHISFRRFANNYTYLHVEMY